MKKQKYSDLLQTIEALIEGETDLIAVMSTIACELFHAFDYFNWVGFYRLVDEGTLKVGPYQGSHGCLTIDVNRGVCGKCVREKTIQIENDVASLPHHIACSSETKAEIVLPVRDRENIVKAVLDIDSIEADVFDAIDVAYLTKICEHLTARYA
jgi:L-methionine (R)-S-oxide reductase